MIGRRLADGEHPVAPGDYSKFRVQSVEGPVDAWMVKVPTGGPACLLGRPNADGSAYHWVRENDDGTITVEPNPLDAPPERRNSNSIGWNGWHGYIDAGAWREA